MMSDKDIEEKIKVRDNHRKWQREYGLIECKRCGGTKIKVADQSQEDHPGNTYIKVKLERCYWCNDDGMVDPWSELMGKKWSEYVHKMY